jgi:hypothetical protein
MPSYVVETYLTHEHAPERLAREDRARAAAAELTRGGTTLRFEFALHVPEDETSFYVFNASSPQLAALAAQHARLDPIRVVEAVTSERIEK